MGEIGEWAEAGGADISLVDVLELTSDVDVDRGLCKVGLRVRRVLHRVLPTSGVMASSVRLKVALGIALGTVLGIMNNRFAYQHLACIRGVIAKVQLLVHDL